MSVLWRLRLIVVLLLLLLGGSVYCWRSSVDALDFAIEQSAGKDVILKRWVTEAGEAKTLSEQRRITIKELKESNDLIVDSLRRSQSKLKSLVSTVRVGISTSDTILVPLTDTVFLYSGDNVVAQIFSWEDPWLSMSGIVRSKNVEISYNVKNDLSFDSRWDRESKWKFWQPKTLYLETTSRNPRTTVDRVQTFVVEPEPRKFYETRLFQLSLGVGVGYYLGYKAK